LFSLAVTPVFAAPPPRESGFICPVLGGQAGENGNSDKQPFVIPPGGFTTVIGPDVTVPEHATNLNGDGSPGGPFASPGEADYSPIWNTE
jgi:hypothetical protein